MIVVGELINASRRAVAEAIEAGDQAAVQELARSQAAAGAAYLDVNAGVFVGKEAGFLRWLVETVQAAVDLPCCLDSPDPEAIAQALAVHRGTAMLNSISLERDRWERMLPVVAGSDLKVVALCMSDEGMPHTSGQRLAIAERLVEGLVRNRVKPEDIFVDPLVQPVSTDQRFGEAFLDAIAQIHTHFPEVHTVCGLSNISYGLPERKFLNRTFMVMAIARGLDAAILDPLDRKMMATVLAAETLAGRDEYCMEYITAYREGRIVH